MKKFAEIYDIAAKRKGGEEPLRQLIQCNLRTPDELASLPEDRYLSAITEVIFKAGFTWKVVESKWDGFEHAFWNFNVRRCAFMSSEDIETLAQDKAIIRNRQKIITVPSNAAMILEMAEDYGGFGQMLSQWPNDDFIGLIKLLSKKGSRLGGNSGFYFLRKVGKDGFVLGRDGVAALIHAGIIDKMPSSQKALAKVQEAYNQWSQESGLSLAQISLVLAFSTGENRF